MDKINKIYEEVVNYCNNKGLLNDLQRSFEIPETTRFLDRDIKLSGLDILDAVHCILDKQKTLIFLKEINNYTDGSKIVLEAGIGTGLLSFVASAKAKKVYGLEINPKIYELANEIRDCLISKDLIDKNKIEFILADATSYIPSERPDIIISENLYTGMLAEQQVQIIRNLKKFIKPKGIIIPAKLSSFVSANYTHFLNTPHHKEIFVPAEMKIKLLSKPLSCEIKYDEIDFNAISRSDVNCDAVMDITNDGEFNSLVIYSVVKMPSGQKIGRYDSTFMNDDIVIALQPFIKVKKGSKIKLQLSYNYGCKTSDMKIHICE